MPQSAARLQSLPPYVFSVIGDQIRNMTQDGIDVIRLDIGNPDLPPPDTVVDALAKSASNPANHGYSGYRGLAAFREAMADYYQRRFAVSLHPDHSILPVIGSKEGLVNLSMAYIDKGDIALVPDIGYPSYAMGTRLAGGEVYWVPLREENSFLPDVESIPDDISQRAKILWVNYPNNPTGATVSQGDFVRLIEFCKRHDILLASDNPYVDITYDDYQAPSALQAAVDANDLQSVIEFFSFSKSYNMAGWRLGAALGSQEAISNLLRIKSNVDSGHFKPVYEAGIEALRTPQTWINDRNRTYKGRRDRILNALPHLGLSASPARGSLYVWAKSKNLAAEEYTERARTEAHVSLAPGEAYGPGGQDYVRISIAVPDERLEQALERLEKWYRQQHIAQQG